jgi:hypothetical protein
VLQERMLVALDRIAWSSIGTNNKLDLLRAYSLIFTLGSPAKQRARDSSRGLIRCSRGDTRPQHPAGQHAAYLQSPAIASKAMTVFRNASTQEEQIEYALALRSLKAG